MGAGPLFFSSNLSGVFCKSTPWPHLCPVAVSLSHYGNVNSKSSAVILSLRSNQSFLCTEPHILFKDMTGIFTSHSPAIACWRPSTEAKSHAVPGDHSNCWSIPLPHFSLRSPGVPSINLVSVSLVSLSHTLWVWIRKICSLFLHVVFCPFNFCSF